MDGVHDYVSLNGDGVARARDVFVKKMDYESSEPRWSILGKRRRNNLSQAGAVSSNSLNPGWGVSSCIACTVEYAAAVRARTHTPHSYVLPLCVLSLPFCVPLYLIHVLTVRQLAACFMGGVFRRLFSP